MLGERDQSKAGNIISMGEWELKQKSRTHSEARRAPGVGFPVTCFALCCYTFVPAALFHRGEKKKKEIQI